MEDVAAIIEQLSARVSALESENARLRGVANASDAPRPVSRRHALRLGGLAAGAAGAAVLLRPGVAGAGVTVPVDKGVDNDATNTSTGLTSVNSTDTLHVANTAGGEVLHVHAGDANNTNDALHVVHDGMGTAIVAEITNGTSGQAAITGTGTHGAGVVGFAGLDPAPGVGGLAASGTGPAIEGVIIDANATTRAIEAIQFGKGHGVYAHIDNEVNGNRALYGHTVGTGQALTGGIANGNSTASSVFGATNGKGAGVEGKSDNGVGGKFTGKTAQVQLVPSTASTHPSSGASGQLFVDTSHRLWYCFGGTSWKQLA